MTSARHNLNAIRRVRRRLPSISPSPLMGEGRTSTSSVESGEGEGILRDVETSNAPSPLTAAPICPDLQAVRAVPRGERGVNAGVLRTPYRSRGFTLVELLVTLVIIMMLTAIAVPVLAPALAGRRQREASREVTSYFAQARDTAMRSGRATGVMLERFTGAGNASTKALVNAGLPPNPVPEMCLTLWQVEVPPPYSGDMLNSRATVMGGFGSGAITALGSPGEGIDMVRIGDYVKFNTQGHQYQILGLIDGSGNQLPPPTTQFLPPPQTNSFWQIMPVGGTTAFVPDFQLGVPYQIIRQPVKTSTPPLQLPEGIVVDLAASGASTPVTNFCITDQTNASLFPLDTSAIIVMFSPSGGVERLYCSLQVANPNVAPVPHLQPPIGPIFFLLGQRERIPSANNQTEENWRDPTSLWITIFPQTGLVTSTENVPATNAPLDTTNLTNVVASRLAAIAYARRLALEGQTLGGR